jgi:hypothetical protein
MAWAWGGGVAVIAALWVTLHTWKTPPASAPAAVPPPLPESTATKPAAKPPAKPGAKSSTPKAAVSKPASPKPDVPKPAGSDIEETEPAAPQPAAPKLAESKPSTPKASAPSAKGPTADVTIRFAHKLRRGTLTVTLDGVAVFSEPFVKRKLTIFQTTVWDPLKAPAGSHTLIAQVKSEDGSTFVSTPYKIEFPKGQEIALRIGMKGKSVTVKTTRS